MYAYYSLKICMTVTQTHVYEIAVDCSEKNLSVYTSTYMIYKT